MPKVTNKQRKTRQKALFAFAFPLSLVAIILAGFFLNVFAPFERRLLDLRFTWFNQNLPVSEDIVFVDFDDRSLETLSKQIGGWPWPRGTVVATYMLDYIMAGNPKILLFDVIYSTYSPKPPGTDIPEEDWIMLEASMAYPNVSHAVLFYDQNLDERVQMFEAAAANFAIPMDDASSEVELPRFDFFLAPYEPLRDYASLLHSVNHMEDADGISRRNQMVVKYGDVYYPGLATRALDAFLTPESYALEGRNLVLELPGGERKEIPLTDNGDYLLNFYPDNNEFEAYPADNIIASAQNFFSNSGGEVWVPPETFEDKIVVIGASALGLKDLKITPMGKNIAGPYLHITAISNVLQDQYLREVPQWLSALIITLIIVAVVLSTLYMPEGVLRNVVGVLVIAGVIAAGALLFREAAVVVDLAATLSAALLSYFGALIFLSLTEAAEKNQISNVMSKYLAPSVMTEVLENYDELIGEVGESREIAILFSDIRSFTTISENYPAERVVDLLNQYLEPMIEVVFQNRGTLDKIIGDAIMAFWGAPNPEDQKAQLAMRTALQMIERLGDLNRRFEEQGNAPIRIGVGVHTGEMIVGNIGSDQRLDYTAIGDNVNLGSRIEGLTKYYKVPILASENTYEATKDDFAYVFLDTVAVKGRTQGIGMYTPLGENGAAEPVRGYGEAFVEARKAYEEQDFANAKKQFDSLEKDEENPLALVSGVFKARCVRFMRTPPPENWNGIWKMTEK